MEILQIILTAIIALIGFWITVKKWKELKTLAKIGLLIGIVLSLVVLYNGIENHRKKELLEKINAKFFR